MFFFVSDLSCCGEKLAQGSKLNRMRQERNQKKTSERELADNTGKSVKLKLVLGENVENPREL